MKISFIGNCLKYLSLQVATRLMSNSAVYLFCFSYVRMIILKSSDQMYMCVEGRRNEREVSNVLQMLKNQKSEVKNLSLRECPFGDPMQILTWPTAWLDSNNVFILCWSRFTFAIVKILNSFRHINWICRLKVKLSVMGTTILYKGIENYYSSLMKRQTWLKNYKICNF